MKTTVHNHHRNSVINYLFFGIAASIFTLSIFFSFYQQEETANFYNDISFMSNSRMLKPMSSSISETQAINLKEMLNDSYETPLTVESWMTEPYVKTISTSTPATYTEAELVLEPWMTDVNSWSIISSPAAYTEVDMVIESWMLDTEEWLMISEINPIYSTNIAEAPLVIEAWMLSLDSWSTTFSDTNYTEAELEVENWMLDTSTWLAKGK